jgi:hypothetical protein
MLMWVSKEGTNLGWRSQKCGSIRLTQYRSKSVEKEWRWKEMTETYQN